MTWIARRLALGLIVIAPGTQCQNDVNNCEVADYLGVQRLDLGATMSCISSTSGPVSSVLASCMSPSVSGACVEWLVGIFSTGVDTSCPCSNPSTTACVGCRVFASSYVFYFGRSDFYHDAGFNGVCLNDLSAGAFSGIDPSSYGFCISTNFAGSGYAAYNICLAQTQGSISEDGCRDELGSSLQITFQTACGPYCANLGSRDCQKCTILAGMVAFGSGAVDPTARTTTTTEDTTTIADTTTITDDTTTIAETTTVVPTTSTTTAAVNASAAYIAEFGDISAQMALDPAIALPAALGVISSMHSFFGSYFASIVSAPNAASLSPTDSRTVSLLVGVSAIGGLAAGQHIAELIVGPDAMGIPSTPTWVNLKSIITSIPTDGLTEAMIRAVCNLATGNVSGSVTTATVFSVVANAASLNQAAASVLLSLAASNDMQNTPVLHNLQALSVDSLGGSVTAAQANAFAVFAGGESDNGVMRALASSLADVSMSSQALIAVFDILSVGVSADTADLASALQTNVAMCQSIPNSLMTTVAESLVDKFASDSDANPALLSWILLDF